MLNVKTSILKNSFIKGLETELLTNPTAEKLSIDQFTEGLWFVLCSISTDPKYYIPLHKELNLKPKANNVGNLQNRILEKLNIINFLN